VISIVIIFFVGLRTSQKRKINFGCAQGTFTRTGCCVLRENGPEKLNCF